MADATRSASTTTLDLEAIRARQHRYVEDGRDGDYFQLLEYDVPALIAEVERLQAAPTSAGQQPVAWISREMLDRLAKGGAAAVHGERSGGTWPMHDPYAEPDVPLFAGAPEAEPKP